MIDQASPIAHTAEQEMLAAYAAGTLTPFQHMLLSCQAELAPDVSGTLASYDVMAGAILETAETETVSDGFLSRLMDELDSDTSSDTAIIATPSKPDWMPDTLADFLKRQDTELAWRSIGPGVQHAPLLQSETGERLYLLRAKGGTKLPVHSHSGEEWTLVLQGGYHVGETGYAVGDMHCEDETCKHQPIIDEGESCISLVVDQGRLMFDNPLLKLMQMITKV